MARALHSSRFEVFMVTKCCQKETVLHKTCGTHATNKIIFDFIWKGKDKVKRLALISDYEDGGLKAPHLEAIIKTQRILCCKNS